MSILGQSPDDNLAPSYTIEVEGSELGIGITELITEVEYESADGCADMLKIQCANPNAIMSDSRIFIPGNEVALWMGYGSNQSWIGAAIIYKVEPNFPESGEPSMVITCYTRDKEMMDNAPPKPKKFKGKGSVKKNRRAKQLSGRHYKDIAYAGAAREKADDYGFLPDVTDGGEITNFIQPSGMSDYEFIQGLSNLTGWLFWVDRTPAGIWQLHFRDPLDSLIDVQDKKYTFEYNNGDLSTLLSFEPEMTFQGQATTLQLEVKNPRTGKIMKAEIEEPVAADNINYTGGRVEDQEQFKGAIPSGSAIKLFIGDYSFEVIATKKFTSEKEIQAWADAWYRKNRDNFVLARGKLNGLETLFARQTHTITGVGVLFSGDYYFSRVRHVMSAETGYITDFSARKILTSDGLDLRDPFAGSAKPPIIPAALPGGDLKNPFGPG